MEKSNITIIGAGVIGLAIAYELSKKYNNILVIEKETKFGTHTSSRNSEVIHAGIYYPQNSLKAVHCVKGNKLIYNLCLKYNIPYKKTGKLVVAQNKEEEEKISSLYENAVKNNVEDIYLLSSKQIKEYEPNINVYAGFFSGSTGVFDTHRFMDFLEYTAKTKKVDFAYNYEVTNIEKLNNIYELTIRDNEEEFRIKTEIVINAAGLFSDKIAQAAGIDIIKAKYKLNFCKGEYFRYNKINKWTKHLIYPVPQKYSLGLHSVLDMNNDLKFGPNAYYVDKIGYNIDKKNKDIFFNDLKSIFPFLEYNDLTPDMSGIRPKLQGENENFRDFIIKEESEKNLKNFINLIGIESPGLTASLSIAEYVKTLL